MISVVDDFSLRVLSCSGARWRLRTGGRKTKTSLRPLHSQELLSEASGGAPRKPDGGRGEGQRLLGKRESSSARLEGAMFLKGPG